nr:capsular polysaccharide synthesis protein [Demequina flava]
MGTQWEGPTLWHLASRVLRDRRSSRSDARGLLQAIERAKGGQESTDVRSLEALAGLLARAGKVGQARKRDVARERLSGDLGGPKDLLEYSPRNYWQRRRTVEWLKRHHDTICSIADSFPTTEGRLDPGTIFIHWGQGIERAPAIVKLLARQPALQSGSFPVLELDSETVPAWVDIPTHVQRLRDNSYPNYAVYVRLALLTRYGGIWMDPTVLVGEGFGKLIASCIQGDVAFMPRFTSVHGGDHRPSNWCIGAGEPGNVLLQRLQAALSLWCVDNDEYPEYHFFHTIVEFLTQVDSGLAQVWATYPTVPSEGAHELALQLPLQYDAELCREILERNPLNKLTYKLPSHVFSPETTIGALLRQDPGLWRHADAAQENRGSKGPCSDP